MGIVSFYNKIIHLHFNVFLLSCFGVLIEVTLLSSVTYVDQLRILCFNNIGGSFYLFLIYFSFLSFLFCAEDASFTCRWNIPRRLSFSSFLSTFIFSLHLFIVYCLIFFIEFFLSLLFFVMATQFGLRCFSIIK